MGFELLPAGPPEQEPEPLRRLGGPHCPVCGRFSKWIKGRSVYLGYGTEYRILVRCAVHGEQEIY